MKENVIQIKSFAFAVSVLKFCKKLKDVDREYQLSDQLLRASCSIGANVEEAIGTNTRKHFQSCITIEYKEAREAYFFMRVIHESALFNHHDEIPKLLGEALEVMRILSAIQRTTRAQLEKEA